MVFICSSHQRSIAALSSSDRSRLWSEWMDMAELNSRCCLWRDAVPLAGCAADVALLEARLQASRLFAAGSSSMDPGRPFARALAMYIVASITLWEAYDQMKLTEKAKAIAAGVALELKRLLAVWVFLPVDLTSCLLAYFERETTKQALDQKSEGEVEGADVFRDDSAMKSFLLRQAELACLLSPLSNRISMMYLAEQSVPTQRLPC